MPVSKSQVDRRPCPACHSEVVSEIWFIVHRHEHPQLWQRAASLRTLTCPNGHSGPVGSPLLLFDPGSPIVIYSPNDKLDLAQVRTEGELLMNVVWKSLPSDQKAASRGLQVVPAEILPILLDSPKLNLGDFAPGTPESDEAFSICADIRSGNVSLDSLHAWLNDEHLHPALRAGIRFELASYLMRMGSDDSWLLEQAISEWRKVLRHYTRAENPRRWAISCLELALCYATRREASPAANTREALRLLDTALEVLTADRYPEDFALACCRKANLLLDIGSTPDLISQSLSAFQSALCVYTKESYPEDWALVLSNMATAYISRGGYSGFDDLRKAAALLEQATSSRTRENAPESWAKKQVNLGIALSRLPAEDGTNPHARAVEALRGAYEVFRELGDTAHELITAYNLGLTLARLEEPLAAEEACEYLEQSLPWLKKTNQFEYMEDAIDLLSQAYMTLLRSRPDPERGDSICRRALSALEDYTDSDSAVQVIYHVGTWLLRHATTHTDHLNLAEAALTRVLGSLHVNKYAELRAAALANFASVLLLQQRESYELDRVRARDSLDEALRILRSLPTTPEREQWIGLILMNQVRSNLGIDKPPSMAN